MYVRNGINRRARDRESFSSGGSYLAPQREKPRESLALSNFAAHRSTARKARIPRGFSFGESMRPILIPLTPSREAAPPPSSLPIDRQSTAIEVSRAGLCRARRGAPLQNRSPASALAHDNYEYVINMRARSDCRERPREGRRRP